MPDILHQFQIKADAGRVFEAVATPEGMDSWWTLDSSGKAEIGAEWRLGFGADCNWKARVTKCAASREFELTMTDAMEDWLETRVGFELTPKDGVTGVKFYHAGWGEASPHYCVSSYCWAMYLRLMRVFVETGEVVAYDKRDSA